MTKTKTAAARAPKGAAKRKTAAQPATRKPKAKAAAPARKARAPKTVAAKPAKAGSRTELCLGLLTRPQGATVAEIMEPTGWQPHTTRAFLSATLGKKLGHKIETEKVDGRGRVYRIAAEGAAA